MRLTKALFLAVDKAVKNIPKFFLTIEEDNGKKEKVFNYSAYTLWCLEEFRGNIHRNTMDDIAYVVRDLALEQYDSKYDSNVPGKTYYLRGFATID